MKMPNPDRSPRKIPNPQDRRGEAYYSAFCHFVFPMRLPLDVSPVPRWYDPPRSESRRWVVHKNEMIERDGRMLVCKVAPKAAAAPVGLEQTGFPRATAKASGIDAGE